MTKMLVRLGVNAIALWAAIELIPGLNYEGSGTSLLIIVVVVMDFMAQLQAHLMSHQYEGLLKKANLKGYGRAGQVR